MDIEQLRPQLNQALKLVRNRKSWLEGLGIYQNLIHENPTNVGLILTVVDAIAETVTNDNIEILFKFVDQAVGLRPNDPDILCYRAFYNKLYRKRRRGLYIEWYALARNDYQSALALDPNHAKALQGMAKLPDTPME
jgi:tetratricopeptide (TPR) repeat protein